MTDVKLTPAQDKALREVAAGNVRWRGGYRYTVVREDVMRRLDRMGLVLRPYGQKPILTRRGREVIANG